MLLPPDARIATEKLTDYLLVRQSRGDKSEFLALAGYRLENYAVLLHDLRNQILTVEANPTDNNEYGQMYEIIGDLHGPNGTVLRVRTIWMTEHLTGTTKFITLIPEKWQE
jgi:hypothetical protein